MYPEINLYGLKIPMFNLCIIVGITVAIVVFLNFEKKIAEHDKDEVLAVIGIALPGGFIAAYLFNKIVFGKRLFQSDILEYQGMTFLGGFLGGILLFSILHLFTFKNKRVLKKHLNLLTPYFVIAQIFGRVGCLCAGCCYGKPSNIGVKFQERTPAYVRYGDVNIFPIQFMEAVLLTMICVVLFGVKVECRFALYLILYGSTRFILEFFRGDDRGVLLGWSSPSQIMCLAIIAAGIIILLANWRKQREGVRI